MPIPGSPSTTDGTLLSGSPVNDAYGNKTEAAGTPITRVIPPRAGARARVCGFRYKAAATAHTLTVLTVLQEVAATADALAGQAVIAFSQIPTAGDGSIMAGSDWIVAQYEDGTWAPHLVSSISGTNVTVSANLAQKIKSGSRIFFMGAPGDHPNRQYTIDASEDYAIQGSEKVGVGTGAKNDQPILVHVDNATNAGRLRYLPFVYDAEV